MEKKLGSFLIQAAISECSNVSYGQAGRFSNDGYSAWIYRPFRNPTLWRERKTQKKHKGRVSRPCFSVRGSCKNAYVDKSFELYRLLFYIHYTYTCRIIIGQDGFARIVVVCVMH